MTNPNKNLRILYLAHDLGDAAVARRAAMLKDGGADVTLMGFRRSEVAPTSISGVSRIVDLGRTFNGGFIRRLGSVARVLLKINRYRGFFDEADVVVARNLEMLAIAAWGQRRREPKIVYEVLDIHRLLLGKGLIAQALRWVEGLCARRSSLLITSSPAFVDHYFQKKSRVALPVYLVENKIYFPGGKIIKSERGPLAAPPWVIGWFGVLRCAKSFRILAELVRRMPGQVRIEMRGRPATDQIPDFYQVIEVTPGLNFSGAYKSPDDLAALYGAVHFTWAVDMYEQGGNSAWLLPNRLYEGGAYGAVPIGQEGVQIGKALTEWGVGVVLPEPFEQALGQFFQELTLPHYQRLQRSVAAVPINRYVATQEDSILLVKKLSEVARG